MADRNGYTLNTFTVLDVPIARATMPEAIDQINHWIRYTEHPRLICFTNVHMVVEARTNIAFRNVMSRMDLNFADGAPIFWMGFRKFGRQVSKISGPEFMPLFCEQSVAHGHSHFLFGGAAGVAQETGQALESSYPGIRIAGHYSPPFAPQTAAESAEMIEHINSSGADVLWVCLGCPKQERWMTEHQHLLKAKVILAVGQAFDILAGRKKRAPSWLSVCGMEWAYRLAHEPKRLFKRYGVTNSIFVLLMTRDFLSRHVQETLSPAHRGTPLL